MMTYSCPIEDHPQRRHTRKELLALIEPHGELLCYFAQAAGYERCVLGVDFDSYDPSSRSVPVLVIESREV